PPNAPSLYDDSGNLNWENSTFDNPLAALNGAYRSYGNYLRANSVLSYRPFKNFELKTNLGYYSTGLEETRTAPNTLYDPSYGLDSSYSLLILNQGNLSSYIVEPQLNYNVNFAKGILDVLVGASVQNDKRTSALWLPVTFQATVLSITPQRLPIF